MLILPLVIPMVLEVLSGSVMKAEGYRNHIIDLVGFFFPHKYHWTSYFIINSLINDAFRANYWEGAGFLGFIVLPIAIWGFIKAKFSLKRYIAAIGIIGFVLALGSVLTILGKPINFIKLPYSIIENIPGLNAARSPDPSF